MKRQAKSPMKSSKKAKAVDLVGPKIKELAAVLSNPECPVPPPSGNRDMLVCALPHALGDFRDDRHPYQNTMTNLISEILQGWVTKWEQNVAEAKTHVDAAENDRVAAIASQENAKSSIDAQEKDVGECKAALKEASDVHKESTTALALANSLVVDFDKDLQKVINEKDNITRVYNQSFLITKNFSDEGFDPSEVKNYLKEITATLKKISTQSSLQIALAPALQKKPSERGKFDNLAIDGVDEVFKEKIEKLNDEISSADTAKAAKEAQAVEAKNTHAATEAKKQECLAALKASEDALGEKKKSLEAAEKNVDVASKTANKALKVHSQQESELDHAKGNLASLQFLVEHTRPPPPAEEISAEA